MVWIVGGLVAQMRCFRYAGFSIATGVVFAATAKAFGRGPLWFTYPVGVVLSLAIWLVFAKGLQLVLPAGPLRSCSNRLASGRTRGGSSDAVGAATWTPSRRSDRASSSRSSR